VIGATDEETPHGWSLLCTNETIDGKAYTHCNEEVNGEAKSGQTRTEQPETLTQAFPFRGLYAARCPHGCNKVLQQKEEQGRSNKYPIGEKGRSDKSTKAAQRVENCTLYHAAPITHFIKHNSHPGDLGGRPYISGFA
jgi:hypothetical protein